MKSPLNYLSKDDAERTAFFDAYLNGTLDPSVKATFEQDLADNANLYAELNVHYALRQLIAKDARHTFVKGLRPATTAVDSVSDTTQKPTITLPLWVRSQRMWWAAAASIAVVVAVAAWWLNRPTIVPIMPIPDMAITTQDTTLKVFKTMTGGELGAVPFDSSFTLRELRVQITTNPNETPQYDLEKDMLHLTLQKPTFPQRIEQPTPFSPFFDVTLEGKHYRLVRGQKGLLKDSLY